MEQEGAKSMRKNRVRFEAGGLRQKKSEIDVFALGLKRSDPQTSNHD